MTLKKTISITLASILLMVQLPMVALADDATPPADPATTTTTTPDPSTLPPPAPTPDPSPAPAPDAPAPTDPATTTTTPPSTPGPTTPPGPDANQYTFNPATGLWESANYTWNPVTKQTAPKVDPGYYYNPTTGMWDTTQYVYHPESNSYQPVTVSSPIAPAAAAGSSALGGGSSDGMLAALAQLLGATDPSNSSTGPNSTNSIVSNTNNSGFFGLFTQAAVNNNLNSNATTGDANVTGNTTGGNAATGSAQVVANLLNLLNSAWSWSTGGLATFVQNLFGNQTGNILLNPVAATSGGGSLGALPGTVDNNSQTGPNSTNTVDTNSANGLMVNSQANGAINNNVNVLAQSGNAGVTGNTTGGNATSGNAAADVNLINLINSAIGAGQSFLGVINVFGNLTGNILFPQGFLDSIAASNTGSAPASSASNSGTGPNSTNTINSNNTNTANLNNTANSGITNNLNTAAQSGNATVAGNTSAGNATTGTAATNTDTFNFAGNLVSDNAVLVLVNVLGHWVGAILNLPSTGTSQSALLTGGPSSLTNTDTGPGSTNSINNSSQNSLDVNATSNGTINNNVKAGAISGNANVSDNTKGGNATSGNASVATNVANFVGSTLNVKHWFGVLMINVFGDWIGNVGTDTPQTAAIVPAAVTGGGSGQTSNTNNSHIHSGASSANVGGTISQTNVASTKTSPVNTKVLSAKQSAATNQSRQITIWVLAAALLMLISGMMLSLDRKLGRAS